MRANRSVRKGNVMLPFEGVVTAFVLFLPCWLFLFGLLHANWPQGLVVGAIPWPMVIPVVGLCAMAGLVGFMLSIGVPICIGTIEAASEQIGLGAVQIWSGRTWREKVCREVARLSLFAVSAGLAFLLTLLLPTHYSDGIRPAAWGAFTQVLVIAIFMAVYYPVKRRWPELGGFVGNPDARYQHAY